MSPVVGRALRLWRHEGPAAVLRRAWARLRERVHVREEHVWYQLDLATERPRRELPREVRLAPAAPDQMELVESLGQSAEVARRRVADGNVLWLAFDRDELLFGCWIFPRRTPVLAAPGGWLELPAGVACLEDSVALPAARGRGIAPGSWTAIADRLAEQGLTTMVTKVGVDNVASRRAVAKSGFREIGVMGFARLGPRRRTSIAQAGDGLGPELAKRLVTP